MSFFSRIAKIKSSTNTVIIKKINIKNYDDPLWKPVAAIISSMSKAKANLRAFVLFAAIV